jgi:hypothetical protein
MELQHARPPSTVSVARTTRRDLTVGGLVAGLLRAIGLRGSAPAAAAAQEGTP